MSASEAAVKAVMDELGCQWYEAPECASGCEWCSAPHCTGHSDWHWTERGCPVAVRVADGVVGVEKPTIRAETLREAADVWANGISVYETWTRGTIARSLRARADRIEAKP